MGRPDVAVRVRGFEPITTRDYPMPPATVRFVGEPVAMVVAETIDQAKDAAELLEIAYEPLPAVVRAANAVKPDAPRLWENAPDNVCTDIEVGDEAATTEAFRRAVHIVRLDTWVQRVTGVPMEPRTEYDAATGHYTLCAGNGRGVAKLRLDLAQVLGVSAEQVRCVCGDMGGNFGTRNFFYPEYALLAWAARRVAATSEIKIAAAGARFRQNGAMPPPHLLDTPVFGVFAIPEHFRRKSTWLKPFANRFLHGSRVHEPNLDNRLPS
jgi:CO/xanthine dehydrogenase Mo-binding subunit